MRLTLLSVIILIALSSNAQTDNNKITYKAEGIYFIQVDKKGNEIARKPEGQNVLLVYDKFFKSYDILYDDADGQVSNLKLEYLANEQDGSIKMKDKKDNIYYVVDLLNSIGK